jgi:tRNA:m4X modification enzyme
VEAKRRFCRGTVHRGSRFCGAHLNFDRSYVPEEGEERVPCPHNPNHSVARKELARHMTVCKDRLLVASAAPYYAEGINGGRGGGSAFFFSAVAPDGAGAATTPLGGAQPLPAARAEFTRMDRRRQETRHYRDLTPEALAKVADLIGRVFEAEVRPHMVPGSRLVAGVEAETTTEGPQQQQASGVGQYAQRQQPQLTALLDAMAAVGAVPFRPTCASAARLTGAQEAPLSTATAAFVELAAGKAAFSLALADRWAGHLATTAHPPGQRFGEGDVPPHIFVADRGGFRRKADGRVAKPDGTGGGDAAAATDDGDASARREGFYRPFVRLRIDLRDLALARVPEMGQRGLSRIVAYGKHLCGNCTDFGLAACLNAVKAEAANLSIACIAVAPCCHHLAEFHNFAPVFGAASVTPTASPDAMVLAAQSKLKELLKEFAGDTFNIVASMTSWGVCCGHGAQEKPQSQDGQQSSITDSTAIAPRRIDPENVKLGLQAKRIIDWMRVLHLRSQGLRAELVDAFVDANESPENALILAWGDTGSVDR